MSGSRLTCMHCGQTIFACCTHFYGDDIALCGAGQIFENADAAISELEGK